MVNSLEASNLNFNVSENFTTSENLLKVEVYFQEFNLEEITEKPAYLVSIWLLQGGKIKWKGEFCLN